jgi:hypothetical protein
VLNGLIFWNIKNVLSSKYTADSIKLDAEWGVFTLLMFDKKFLWDLSTNWRNLILSHNTDTFYGIQNVSFNHHNIGIPYSHKD